MEKIIRMDPLLHFDKESTPKERISKLSKRLQYLETKVKEAKENTKVSFSTADSVHYFYIKDIVYIKAEGSYCSIYINDGEKLIISRSLKQVSKELPTDLFKRIHQSFLVNNSYIKKYLKKESKIILENKTTLPVSRSKKSQIYE